eukprot:jgi/Psemu1/308255/fgenesh1_kg.392_\
MEIAEMYRARANLEMNDTGSLTAYGIEASLFLFKSLEGSDGRAQFVGGRQFSPQNPNSPSPSLPTAEILHAVFLTL